MIDGHDHELAADDLLIAMQPLEGYQLEREGSHAVALELTLDDELRGEGLAREVVHAVQAARKAAGLDVSDRIALTLGGAERAARRRARARAYVAGETLATSRSPTTTLRRGPASPSRSRAAPLRIAVALA